MKWYRIAAEQGDAQAQNSLGILYGNGQGSTRDYGHAAFWFRQAADQGNAAAQNNIATIYAMGEGTPQDYTQAADWYRKAAQQGNTAAQAALASLYLSGQGVRPDNSEALKWLQPAAAKGNTGALTQLASLYQSGQGVPRDPVIAQMLSLILAAVTALDSSGAALSDAPAWHSALHSAEADASPATTLSPAQWQEAQSLADSWVPGTPLPGKRQTGGTQ